MNLATLCRKYGTDKGTDSGETGHCYDLLYERLLRARRGEVRSVLEIGVYAGASLRVWRDYFPAASVYGIDLYDCCLFEEERIRCFQANQDRPEELLRATAGLTFDLIIDDGSHSRAAQLTTLRTLLPTLNDGGDYFIEDVDTRQNDPVKLTDDCVDICKRHIVETWSDIRFQTTSYDLRPYRGRPDDYVIHVHRGCRSLSRFPEGPTAAKIADYFLVEED